MLMNWASIDEFIVIVTTSPFTRAATLVRMSPTHVSRSIIALEHRVQARLFHRTTRTVRLTTPARYFSSCVREWRRSATRLRL
jgi:DNA-binding transcriptional LysR family regulator